MFILRTLNVNHSKDMSLHVKDNANGLTVVEPMATKVGKGGKEIVSLGINRNNLIVPHLLATANNFKDNEYELFMALWNMMDVSNDLDVSNGMDKDVLIKYCIATYCKRDVTYKRAIDSLVVKGVVSKRPGTNVIRPVGAYEYRRVDTTAVKYIVVEVATSGGSRASV